MRFLMGSALVVAGLLAAPLPSMADQAEREARVRFNASLPPNCTRGWNGRGIGLVAICALGNRMQVRYIDGRVAVCAAAGCADHAAEIEGFLRRRGF